MSDEIREAANAVLDEMISDLLLSTVMSAHREIKRGRANCGTCGTRCRAHLPLQPSTFTSSSSLAPNLSGSISATPSRPTSPQLPSTGENASASGSGSGIGRTNGYLVGPEKGTGGATGIGSGSGRMDNGNVYFDCLVCGRAIVSNRYAPHLASCLGLNGSTRRGAARSAAAKARMGNNDRSSPSPYVHSAAGAGSDNGDYYSDGDSATSKKKKMLNGNGKRGRSPGKVPLGKKTKLGSSSGSATPTPLVQRQALPPSKLGRPPTRPAPSSPASSPAKSVISITSSGGGMTGAKTLPGQNTAGTGIGLGMTISNEVVPDPGDESSEGADDDY